MIPKISKVGKIGHNECKMCGAKGRVDFYDYMSPLSSTHLIICKKCAVREYYGNKGSQSKLYAKEKEKGKIFGKSLSSD